MRDMASEVLVVHVLIGRYQRDFIADDAAHESGFGLGISVAYHASNHITLAGYRANDPDLTVTEASTGLALLTAFLGPMAILVLTADIGFVSLNLALKREGIAAHSCAPAMTHIPACPPI